MQSAKRLFPRLHSPQQRHLVMVPLFAYKFLIDGPIWTTFGINITADGSTRSGEAHQRVCEDSYHI